MSEIVKIYSQVAFLLKLAKLNDDEYKKLYHILYTNPEWKLKFEELGLLDQFFNAMPTKSEKEIFNDISMFESTPRKTGEALSLIGSSAKLKVFLAKYGNDLVDIQFEISTGKKQSLFGVIKNRFIQQYNEVKHELYDTTMLDEMIFGVKGKKLSTFCLEYLIKPKTSITTLENLAKRYEMAIKSVNRFEEEAKQGIRSTATKLHLINAASIYYDELISAIYYVNSEGVADRARQQSYEKAYKIRQSDMFDQYKILEMPKKEMRPTPRSVTIPPQQQQQPSAPANIEPQLSSEKDEDRTKPGRKL